MNPEIETKLKELARKCSEQLCCDCGENLNAVNATVIRAYEMGASESNAELRRIVGVNHGLSEAVDIYQERCKKLEEKLRVAKEFIKQFRFDNGEYVWPSALAVLEKEEK